MKLPMKAAILNWAIDHKEQGFKVSDVIEAMRPLYGNERQFTKERIASYCDDFGQINFFKPQNIEITPEGEPDITYGVTDYAIERGNRFIPCRKKAKKEN